jgi:hypothetical protein
MCYFQWAMAMFDVPINTQEFCDQV